MVYTQMDSGNVSLLLIFTKHSLWYSLHIPDSWNTSIHALYIRPFYQLFIGIIWTRHTSGQCSLVHDTVVHMEPILVDGYCSHRKRVHD